MEEQLQTSPPYVQNSKQQGLYPNPPPPPPPSHEFSFTISLHNMSSPPSNPSTAIDLTPADDIFLHGHLLPLHLLSNLPRASANAADLPPENRNHLNNASTIDDNPRRESAKSRALSLFKIPSNWRKEGKSNSNPQVDDSNNHEQKSRTPKFDAMKRFIRLIKLKPRFFSFRKSNCDDFLIQKQQFSSFSGNLRVRSKRGRRRAAEQSSAPVTTRNSRANSGILVATGAVSPTKSDSTMEELQAAIQAAIAHCKNSITRESEISGL